MAGEALNKSLIEVSLDEIGVGARSRTDLGDIDRLAASIEKLGLLEPIALTADGRLLCGARRVAAFRKLGRDRIGAVVIRTPADAWGVLAAEVAENVERKSFTPSEAVRAGRGFERLLREAARGRKGGRPRKTAGNVPAVVGPEAPDAQDQAAKKAPGALPGVSGGDVRDSVGAIVGLCGRSYELAKAVVEAAEANPRRFGDLLIQMDDTGRIMPAWRELRRRQQSRSTRCPAGPAIVTLIDRLMAEIDRQLRSRKPDLKSLRRQVAVLRARILREAKRDKRADK